MDTDEIFDRADDARKAAKENPPVESQNRLSPTGISEIEKVRRAGLRAIAAETRSKQRAYDLAAREQLRANRAEEEVRRLRAAVARVEAIEWEAIARAIVEVTVGIADDDTDEEIEGEIENWSDEADAVIALYRTALDGKESPDE